MGHMKNHDGRIPVRGTKLKDNENNDLGDGGGHCSYLRKLYLEGNLEKEAIDKLEVANFPFEKNFKSRSSEDIQKRRKELRIRVNSLVRYMRKNGHRPKEKERLKDIKGNDLVNGKSFCQNLVQKKKNGKLDEDIEKDLESVGFFTQKNKHINVQERTKTLENRIKALIRYFKKYKMPPTGSEMLKDVIGNDLINGSDFSQKLRRWYRDCNSNDFKSILLKYKNDLVQAGFSLEYNKKSQGAKAQLLIERREMGVLAVVNDLIELKNEKGRFPTDDDYSKLTEKWNKDAYNTLQSIRKKYRNNNLPEKAYKALKENGFGDYCIIDPMLAVNKLKAKCDFLISFANNKGKIPTDLEIASLEGPWDRNFTIYNLFEELDKKNEAVYSDMKQKLLQAGIGRKWSGAKKTGKGRGRDGSTLFTFEEAVNYCKDNIKPNIDIDKPDNVQRWWNSYIQLHKINRKMPRDPYQVYQNEDGWNNLRTFLNGEISKKGKKRKTVAQAKSKRKKRKKITPEQKLWINQYVDVISKNVEVISTIPTFEFRNECYQCPQCSYNNPKKRNTSRHYKSRHMEKKFQCPCCKTMFATKQNLKQHIERCTEGALKEAEKIYLL